MNKAVVVHLDPATADAINSLAAPCGMTIEEYLKRQFGKSRKPKFKTVEEIDAWLNELSEGLPELPILPLDFSRDDIYADHD